jgi:hypothetical protein
MTEQNNASSQLHAAWWRRIPWCCSRKTAWVCLAGGGALLVILQLLKE